MKKKAMRVKIRSRIPFPPTRVFKDRKKEGRKNACRSHPIYQKPGDYKSRIYAV